MKAFNKKRKNKHTTKTKWLKGIYMHFAVYRNSKSYSLSDGIFGNYKAKAYCRLNFIN
ncbi:hypothetical protein [Fusobacterium varium]|uniref:hypothetical protein n=1 Tax=Fusobacterium varium TaxID=856 RepID=UPI0030D43B41